jgi:hypothetical protein
MPRQLNERRLAAAGVSLILLALLGYWHLITSAGGVTQWLAEGRGATQWENVSGYLATLTVLLPFGAIILAFRSVMFDVHWVDSLFSWTVALLIWLWLVYMGTRSGTILMSLGLLSAAYMPKRKSPPLPLLMIIGIGLYFLVNFQAGYRHYFTGLSFHLDEINWVEAKENLFPVWLGGSRRADTIDSTPYAEFNCAMTVVEVVPSRIPYNYGSGHLELFTRPIPRSLWPDKRYPFYETYTPIFKEGNLTTSTIATARENLLTGPSFSFVGHWYSVGGPLAVIVFAFLTGCFLRMLRTLYDRSATSQGDMILYASLIYLGFLEAASEPLCWLYTLPLTHIPLIGALFWCRRRSNDSAGRSSIG